MNRTDDECYTGTGPAAEVGGVSDNDIKAFALRHAPRLAEGIAEMCGQVIAKGLTGVLEHCAELQHRVNALEATLKAHGIPLYEAANGWKQPTYTDGAAHAGQANQSQPSYAELLAQRDELADKLRWRDSDEELPNEGQEVLVTFHPYNNTAYSRIVMSAVFRDGIYSDPHDGTALWRPSHWLPLKLPNAAHASCEGIAQTCADAILALGKE